MHVSIHLLYMGCTYATCQLCKILVSTVYRLILIKASLFEYRIAQSFDGGKV